jgi:pyruvate/2-oxoglutarate/acetoin dehydrogenase E1 component
VSTSFRSGRRASPVRAEELDASAEVIDVRSLKPLDESTLLGSVAKTGRAVIVQEAPRVAGFGAEIAAILAEKAMLDLRGPVVRVTGYDAPFPFWSLEDEYLPTPVRVVEAVESVLRF